MAKLEPEDQEVLQAMLCTIYIYIYIYICIHTCAQ